FGDLPAGRSARHTLRQRSRSRTHHSHRGAYASGAPMTIDAPDAPDPSVPKRRRLVRKRWVALAVPAGLLPVAHGGIALATRIRPPAIELPHENPVEAPGGIERMGAGYTRLRAGVREVYLEGPPERIGAEHTRLLRPRMVENELDLWDNFAKAVPF